MKKVIDFIGKSKIFFIISLSIIVIGIVCNFIFGTTLDIQFKGGSIITYGFVGEISEDTLKNTIQQATPDNTVTFTITKDILNNTESEDAYAISIQFSGKDNISTEDQQKITDALVAAFPDNHFEYQETSSVESSMGLKFLLKCIAAVALASILMVVYVTIRFSRIGGFSAGMFALVALFHDVAMIYFFYVIFRMPIDSNFIAVVLMILGYSLNDTIVIYDRVREERRLAPPDEDIGSIFNRSASAVITRTIATSVTTLVAIGTVYVVAVIFSLSSVQSFALPMMIGIVSGCYSSLCIAGPLWVFWRKSHPETKTSVPKPGVILALGIVAIVLHLVSGYASVVGMIVGAVFGSAVLGYFISITFAIVGLAISIYGIYKSNVYRKMGGSAKGVANVGRIMCIVATIVGVASLISGIVSICLK